MLQTAEESLTKGKGNCVLLVQGGKGKKKFKKAKKNGPKGKGNTEPKSNSSKLNLKVEWLKIPFVITVVKLATGRGISNSIWQPRKGVKLLLQELKRSSRNVDLEDARDIGFPLMFGTYPSLIHSSAFAERVVVFATRRMGQAPGNDRQAVPHGEPEHMSTIITGSVSSVDSSRTFVLGKRRKNKRQSYESKERYQRAHRKARIAKLRIWKRRKAAWERDDPEETLSVDSANSICGSGGDNPPVDSARPDEWEWVAC
ncbi:unnamed protein product [Cuscuta campestris]|uniref:Uncharacterized protein n=1 Tax=Cuscuta campestris TaxID=132261 RepID=A0A484NBX9_9ASTE|nr:unnamed protein product [Cuscuta campestris]